MEDYLMKYLTKEWIGNYERMIFAKSVKSNGNMERLTELAYKRMYKKYKTDFINEFRKDPRFEDGSLIWSDEYAEENFKAHMEIREKVFDSFPEEIKKELNNKDCILIGYCSTKEKTILRRYVREYTTYAEEMGERSIKDTEAAADCLPTEIDFDIYNDKFVYDIKRKGTNIIIDFGGRFLSLHNATVITNDNLPIKQWDEESPHSEWTRLIGLELHTYDEKEFEFNMLLENRDDLERAEYWYYEVKCDNVSELSIPSDDDF